MYTVSQNCFKTETDTIANNNDSTQISSLYVMTKSWSSEQMSLARSWLRVL